MLRAIIIDDEENGRISLREKIKNYCPDVELVGEAAGAQPGLELIDMEDPDIVFLDIEMPGMDGFEMLDELPDRAFHLIFTTAHSRYGIEAVKAAASDYLLKPVDIEELKTAIERIKKPQQRYAEQPDEVLAASVTPRPLNRKITIPTMEGLVFIAVDDIIHVEAQDNYTVFHLTEQPKLTVSKTLKEFEDLLPADRFYRVHNSHIVNLNFVRKYFKGKGGRIEMQNGNVVEVSRRKKDEFLRLIS